MTTTQTVIIICTFIAMSIAFVKSSMQDDYRKRQQWTILHLLISSIIFAISISVITINNDLQEKVKNKCPNLEVVEGVYKIK